MIHTFDPIVLPPEWGFSRNLPRRAQDSGHPTWNRYDRNTLAYGAVHIPNRVRLYLPRTFNLWPLIAEAEVSIDGRPVAVPRRKIHRRFEVLDFPWEGPEPAEMTLSSASLGKVPLAVASGDSAPYEGRRVIYTMLRNERLDWVRDWLLFHQRVQGADAALISDNGSTDYTSEELLETMRSVPGYAMTEVLEVPLPWGPHQRLQGVDDGKFLQSAFLNYVRDRFLPKAAGVLCVDVDELVVPCSDRSAFEIAKRWGYATFRGSWHYARVTDLPLRHADHVLIDPSEKLCPTKYVYVPSSFLGRGCLSVHSLERVPRNFFMTRELRFLHCKGISTFWKIDRSNMHRPGLRPDPLAEATFAHAFV